MKKYKLLRYGHCYINQTGDLVISLLKGTKKKGYQFVAQCCSPLLFLGKLQTLSRIVPNDGNWIEIDPLQFNEASALMLNGYCVKVPAVRRDFPPVLKLNNI